LVLALLEKETLNKEEISEIFAKLKRQPARPAWTGSTKRKPSSKPPVKLEKTEKKPTSVSRNKAAKPK